MIFHSLLIIFDIHGPTIEFTTKTTSTDNDQFFHKFLHCALVRRIATVNNQSGSGDPSGRVSQQKGDRMGDIQSIA